MIELIMDISSYSYLSHFCIGIFIFSPFTVLKATGGFQCFQWHISGQDVSLEQNMDAWLIKILSPTSF